MQEAPEILDELGDRVDVQSERPPQPLDGRRIRLGAEPRQYRIAGRQPDEAEGDDHHPERHRGRPDQPAGQPHANAASFGFRLPGHTRLSSHARP